MSNQVSDPSVAFVDMLRDAERRKQSLPAAPVNSLRLRLLYGAGLGLLVGLLYGLITQSMNDLYLSGIALAHLPFGQIGNISVYALAGALLGGLTAAPRGAINGVTLAGIAFSLLYILRAGMMNWMPWFMASLPLVLQIAILLAGIMALYLIGLVPLGLLRWSIDAQQEHHEQRLISWVRLRYLLAVLVIIGSAAWLTLYPPHVLASLRTMQDVIERGRSAQTVDDLIMGTRSEPLLQDFRTWGAADYELRPSSDLSYIRDFAVEPTDTSVIVSANFENGWRLDCAFNTEAGIRCMSFQP